MKLEKFMKMYDKIIPDERGCRNWPLSRTGSDYARAYVSEFPGEQRAHRIALRIKLGRPLNHHALHECDNPICVSYDHLYEGKHEDNMKDRDDRGRTARGTRNGQNGTKHFSTKLTEDRVKIIRRLYSLGGVTQEALAKRFQTSPTRVRAIIKGQSWKQVS